MTISSIYNSLINEPNQMIDDGNHHHHNLLNLLSTNQTSTTAATISTTAMINELNNVLNNQYDRNEFYGEIFHRLNYEYRNIHGYLSLVVCVFGIIANVLNIIVLTRKNMESPTNTILTGMAVSDLLVIASFLPYVIHNYIRTEVPEEQMYNYGWAVFTLFHAHNTVLFHTISIWLTVLLAVWRFITVRTPLRTRSLLTIGRARLYILLVYLIVPIFCIPVFITFTIHPIPVINQHKNISIYTVDIVKLEGKNHELLEKITFWVFSVFMKLIPCGLLTCITLALIRILIEAKKRKERLLKGNFPVASKSSASIINHNNGNNNPTISINIPNQNNQIRSSPTTATAVATAEASIKSQSNQNNTDDIHQSNSENDKSDNQKQPKLAKIDQLAKPINSKSNKNHHHHHPVNFVLYCLMSQQFRKTFSQLFCIRWTVEMENVGRHHHHHNNHTRHSCIGSPTTTMIIPQQQQQQSNRTLQSDYNDRILQQKQQQQQQNPEQIENQNESISMKINMIIMFYKL
ncbi:G-protein coupled receptor [Dermatophagoides pteronyssinus]|uniref:G-protein coupled receptor n=1 Tax=Dermatophagoides pteronyssinus TaxID=6956 RepID=A0ABQ8J6C9_DERPT|nr:G-protein coupled receptor [Dermatophagoides pteronyssinus]